jgi:hypothetical protein
MIVNAFLTGAKHFLANFLNYLGYTLLPMVLYKSRNDRTAALR